MLRWLFRRGTATLTCEVDATRGHRFEVSVVPHWNVAASSIEQFDDLISALERHAEIANRLRQTGWTVADHMGTRRVRSGRVSMPIAA
jgi:hypothetical protein